MARIPIGSRDWPNWVEEGDRFFKDMPDLLAWKTSPPSAHELSMFCSDAGHAEQPYNIFYASLPYILDAIEPLPLDQQCQLVASVAGRFITAIEFAEGQPAILRDQMMSAIPRMHDLVFKLLKKRRVEDHDHIVAIVAIITASAGHFDLSRRITEVGDL